VQKDAAKIGIRRREAATATRRVLDAGFLAGSGSTDEHIAAPTGTAGELALDVAHVGIRRRKLSGAAVVGRAASAHSLCAKIVHVRFPWRAFNRGNHVAGVDLSSLSM
jgi:hypothetical protein